MRALAILTVKDEGAFILEWLAHHEACGFTDFLVFSNDCSDGTELMLDRLAAMGRIAHVPQRGPFARGPQWAMLRAARDHPLVRQADWILVCDVDEFVNIHTGDRTLGALLAALPEATAIALTWRLFGNAGVVAFEDARVTATFTRAAPAVLHWPWRASMFKTLFRNDGSYGALGVHRPRHPDPARMAAQRWFDGSGAELAAAYRTGRLFTPPGRDAGALVQLNHYALGSMEGFVVKCARGRANRDASPFDMRYWVERNFAAVEDRTILRLASAAGHEALMADAVLARLHASAVAWRKARFRALMAEEAWRSLFGCLMLAPPSRVIGPEAAREVWRHGIPGTAGPRA